MTNETITPYSAPNHIVAAWMKEHGLQEATRHAGSRVAVYTADEAPGLFIAVSPTAVYVCYDDEDGEIHHEEPFKDGEKI